MFNFYVQWYKADSTKLNCLEIVNVRFYTVLSLDTFLLYDAYKVIHFLQNYAKGNI